MKPDEIKAMRLNLGLSQEHFARKLGVALGTVNRWERGRIRPKGLYAQALETLRQAADKE